MAPPPESSPERSQADESEYSYESSEKAAKPKLVPKAAAAKAVERGRSPKQEKTERSRKGSPTRDRREGDSRSQKEQAASARSSRGGKDDTVTRPVSPENPPREGDGSEQGRTRCALCWRKVGSSSAAREQHEYGNLYCLTWQHFRALPKPEHNNAGWKKAQEAAANLKHARDKRQYPEEATRGRWPLAGAVPAGPSSPRGPWCVGGDGAASQEAQSRREKLFTKFAKA